MRECGVRNGNFVNGLVWDLPHGNNQGNWVAVAILVRTTLNNKNIKYHYREIDVNSESFLIINVRSPYVSKTKQQVEYLNRLSLLISNMENVQEVNPDAQH